jgi:hypothetical protein
MTPAAPPIASSSDSDELSVERIAEALDRRGLAGPASILLDAHQPFLPLVSQGVIFLGPLLAPLIGPRRFAALRRAIDDPDALDRLASRLARPGHRRTGAS